MIKKRCIGLSILIVISFVSCKEAEKATSNPENDYAATEKSVSKPEIPLKTDSMKQEVKITDSLNIKQIQDAEGKYVAENCEKGRFSIELEDKGSKIGYKIYDKKKIIASGRANVSQMEKTSDLNIIMGAIGGILEGDTLTIQNSGNSMNAFDHFGQCPDKYLDFIRK